jgi:hypothetical protein
MFSRKALGFFTASHAHRAARQRVNTFSSSALT